MATKTSNTKDKEAIKWLDKYLRYTDYLSTAQLYLKDNFFLERELKIITILYTNPLMNILKKKVLGL